MGGREFQLWIDPHTWAGRLEFERAWKRALGEQRLYAEFFGNGRFRGRCPPTTRAWHLWICGAQLLAAALSPSPVQAAPECADPIATITSVQGTVEVLAKGSAGWTAATLDQVLCGDEQVRTGPLSRAQIRLEQTPERRGAGATLLHLDQQTALGLPPTKPTSWWIELKEGAASFLSRTPKKFEVRTDFANAKVEGTEFLVVRFPDRTEVTVYDGKVAVRNRIGGVELTSWEHATAKADQPPTKREIPIHQRDAVNWALYYPPIVDLRAATMTAYSPQMASAVAIYERGHVVGALSALETTPEPSRDSAYFNLHAGLLLSVGRVDLAKRDLEQVFAENGDDATAIALQSIIALTQNRKDEALQLATLAVASDKESPIPQVALSYAQQAMFDLDGALVSATEAAKLSPENALAWTRVAELELSNSNISAAGKAAVNALKIAPNSSRAHTMAGFIALAHINVAEAKGEFSKAIEIDSSEPMSRLGLGVAKIRGGDLSGGRQDLELAANLDPLNSLLRSYLGKAYFEEKRNKVSASELAYAKALDPMDPTPWLYDAIRKQSENFPVGALDDFEQSSTLNDNRAVYRSRLMLDDDNADRSVSLGRNFSDLGFDKLTLLEGSKSVRHAPASDAGHRLLADSYASLPKHEVARVSELLQAQLLQSITNAPLQPALAESRAFLIRNAGPSRMGFNEFNPMFTRNGNNLLFSGVIGGNSTFGDEASVSGVHGSASYGLSQLHYETDGFRKNNELSKNIYGAFGQLALDHQTDVQSEIRHTDTREGDMLMGFDPDNFQDDLESEDSSDSVRFGFHRVSRPGLDWIGSVVYRQEEFTIDKRDPAFPFFVARQSDSVQGEFQNIFSVDSFSVISGFGHYHAFLDTVLDGLFVGSSRDKSTNYGSNAYFYSRYTWSENLSAELGLSVDDIKENETNRFSVNPKVGLTWNYSPATTVRGAYFKSAKRAFLANQTIEPTQIAGFNQFFDDINGTMITNYGVGIDHRFQSNLFWGAEIVYRDLEKVHLELVGDFKWRERRARTFCYLVPLESLVTSIEYSFEDLDRTVDFPGAEDFVEVATHKIPISVKYFLPHRFSINAMLTYIDQSGVFFDSNGDLLRGNSSFWMTDIEVGYRMPGRFGAIGIAIRNALNEQSPFHETDIATPSIARERLVLGSWTLAY